MFGTEFTGKTFALFCFALARGMQGGFYLNYLPLKIKKGADC